MSEIRPADHLDASLPVDQRVAALLAQMTLDEKLAQLGCLWITSLVRNDRFDPEVAAQRLRHGMGQVTRIGASTGLHPDESAQLMNDIQRVAVERTRLGIPVIVHEESTGGYCARDATVFPQGIGLASTWDPGLIGEVAAVIRDQMAAVGARLTLAPVLDIARDPRWGRVEETYGEDPVLAGAIGAAYVAGMQTKDLRRGVAATGKHFLGYGLPEGGMNHAPVHLGPRELREVYAEPFAAAIRESGLASIMNSYSSIDGVPCAGSAAILDDLLRGELGFDGVVVADYYAVVLLKSHHRVAASKGDAAVAALSAGMDMELPALDCYGAPLAERIAHGVIEESVVDRSVARVLALKFQLGLFEEPYVDAAAATAVFDTPEQRLLARTAASRSLVLLHNDGVLPINPAAGTIAVVGPTADDRRLLQGDYHYPAHVEIVYEGSLLPPMDSPEELSAPHSDGLDFLPQAGGAFAPGPHYTPHITPLEGIRAQTSARIVHQPGCGLLDDPGDDATIAAAVAAAANADVAVVCVGGKSGLQLHCTVGEARDATDLRLTGAQSRLVTEVIATGTPTVVVLLGGRVFAVPELVADGSALLQAWLPGEEGGNAIAEVLFGVANPAGRLPVTMPRSTGQVPIYAGHRAGGGHAQFHGEYTDSPTTPLFAFGHGLSYTCFEYREFTVEALTTTEPITCSVEVANTGDRDGDEVVQLYIRDDVASVARPRMLVGFTRVHLVAGSSRVVTFRVDPSRLAFYDQSMRFVVEPGTFTVAVGASSADTRCETVVSLTGEVAEFVQRNIVATQVTIS